MEYNEKIKQELLKYPYEVTKKDDFDAFWEKNLKSLDGKPLALKKEKVEYSSPYVEVYEISFLGGDETRIHGWFMVPAFLKKEKYPCFIHYHGFGGSRGEPMELLSWIMMGCCVLSCDCRGQSEVTRDAHIYQTGLNTSVVTQGILDPEDYYYKFLYLDAIRVVDAACSFSEVDENKIVVEGSSQGGMLSLVVACLDDRIKAVLCDVPSGCQLNQKVINKEGSHASIAEFLRRFPDKSDQVFDTLSYFDIVNMADKITCPVFASVGAQDPTCPAKYFMGAYQRITAPKQVEVYPFGVHAVSALQQEKKMKFLKQIIF